MPRYRLTVAYDGTNFHGWQKQCPEGQEPLRTVQSVLETAVSGVVREPVQVLGASRTDAGAHAIGQVAAFNCLARIEPARMAAAINARLPDDVQVRGARMANDGFSPITDAIAKGYRYRIVFGRGGPDGAPRPLFGRFTNFWTPYALRAEPMNEAARRIIGRHDFASFTRLNHGRQTTVRTVFDCRVDAAGRGRLRMEIVGDGFLHNMVRIIAGTLHEVGRGKLEPPDVDRILAAADRAAAGPTLPAEGLCLLWVAYREP